MAIAGLSARPYLDHHVHLQLARDLRRHQYDVIHASERGAERELDEEHLRWAAMDGRVIITFDVHDFPTLAERWFLDERQHAGILLSFPPPLVPYPILLRRLLSLLDQMSAEDLVNQVLWIDESW